MKPQRADAILHCSTPTSRVDVTVTSLPQIDVSWTAKRSEELKHSEQLDLLACEHFGN